MIMIQREDIQFQSRGSACRGWLFKPSQAGKMPCVILAHGFCGVKEMRLDAYAERFAAAGYHALVFDYRHFGDSDGQPRQILDIKKQHQDWHAAIAFARSLPGVDPKKIIVWGTSFSGGHVLAVAAEDKNIAAVISQVPHMNGLATALAAGPAQNVRLGVAAFRDITRALLGRSPFYVPALGRPGELAAMTAEGEFEASRKLYPEKGRFNETVAARIFLSLGSYSPGKLAAKIQVPVLIQVALKDATTPSKPTIKAAKQAPKGKLITYDRGHFDVYVEPDFKQTIKDQLIFLKKHIG
ncbi:MAG: alpha/beta fold hydrolase [Thermodesulfobacteriota bacterium]